MHDKMTLVPYPDIIHYIRVYFMISCMISQKPNLFSGIQQSGKSRAEYGSAKSAVFEEHFRGDVRNAGGPG